MKILILSVRYGYPFRSTMFILFLLLCQLFIAQAFCKFIKDNISLSLSHYDIILSSICDLRCSYIVSLWLIVISVSYVYTLLCSCSCFLSIISLDYQAYTNTFEEMVESYRAQIHYTVNGS